MQCTGKPGNTDRRTDTVKVHVAVTADDDIAGAGNQLTQRVGHDTHPDTAAFFRGFRRSAEELDIFSGYLVNHGAPKTRDDITGLMNVRALAERMTTAIENGEQLTVVRLEVRNLSRTQMLYGEKEVSGLIRSFASICLRAVENRGEVYLGTNDGFMLMALVPEKAILADDGESAPYNGYRDNNTFNTDKARSSGFVFSHIDEWIYPLLDHYIES